MSQELSTSTREEMVESYNTLDEFKDIKDLKYPDIPETILGQ